MSWEGMIGASLAALVALSAWCLVRGAREFGRARSRTSAALVWTIYVLHLVIVIAVSVDPPWPLPIPWWFAAAAGSLLLVGGVALTAAGMLAFGTVARMSGRETGRLITGGIYAWSRNPQNVGWIAAQLGISLLGRSALGLTMSTVFGIIFLIYVRFEERHLAAIYGDEYRDYLRGSHRILGRPDSVRRLDGGASDRISSPQGSRFRDRETHSPMPPENLRLPANAPVSRDDGAIATTQVHGRPHRQPPH